MNYTFYALKLTLKYINRYPIYWFWFFLRFIQVALTLLSPIFFGLLIDVLSSNDINMNKVYLFGGLFIFITITNPLFNILTVRKGLKIANKVSRDFRNDAVKQLENAKLDFFKRKKKGQIISVIDSAYRSIYQMSDQIIHRYLRAFILIFGIFFSAVFFNNFVLIAFISVILFSILNIIILGKREEKIDLTYNKKEEKVAWKLTEFLNNFRTVFYLNLFKKQRMDIFKLTEKAYLKRKERIRASMLKWYNDGQLHSLILILVFIYSLLNVLKGNFTVGILVIVVSFSQRLSDQLSMLLDYSSSYLQISNSLRRYNETLKELKPSKKKKDLIKNDFKRISFKGVSIERENRENLQNINFTINKRERVAIVGETGGGKSTVLDILLKAINRYKGKVNLNNQNYKKVSTSEATKFFSVIPQEVQLFNTSIRENLLTNSQHIKDKKIKKILKICRLDSFVERLPHKLNQKISEGSTNISGGERQRIGIARALIQEHPVLILDEAMANLDPKTEKEIMKNIFTEYPDLTIIYVTHKYSLLNYFDKIFVISNGKIVEKGTFRKLKKNNGLFNKLYSASEIK